MKPKVKASKCVMCWTCIDNCPVDAIKVSKKTDKAWINSKKCIDCGTCIEMCPVKAIKRRK